MAAFCSPRFYHPAAAEPIAIKGLFQFLDNLQDDLNLQNVLQQSINEQSAPAKKQEQPLPTFTPRFDISETDSAYLLHGELPGLSKDNIDIDFTDAQTITVRGKVERAVPSTSTSSQTHEDVVVEDAAPQSPASSAASHHATVEDDFEDLAAETSSAASTHTAAAPTEKTTQVPEQKKQKPAEPEQPQAKFWISERKFGQFARSFKFRKTVDVAGVSASLDNGVLSIVVPKKNESRKIFVH